MDEAKNMALLFFMDHLMQKNGRRTIHDLSCQFGARGFSQEMRDAVGATQEVTLKGFGEMDSKNHLMKIPMSGRQRDYTAEAVKFFVGKLEKFGPELQIKSLLGHRSQAAPEVRLVSGRHLREFYEFLEAQIEHFVVEGDRVRLANMLEPKDIDESEILDDEGRPLAGIKAKQASVEFLKGILEQNEDNPIPLDTFYRRFCERFPHSVRQDVATNPKELLQFLKLNRNIFFIRSNKVSLVRNRDDGNGSESGRSTASLESASSTPAANGSCNGDSINIFSLNSDNLHRLRLVKALKSAQEVVNEIINDLNNSSQQQKQAEQQNGLLEKFVCVDFKLITLGANYNNGSGANSAEDYLSAICLATPHRIAVFDLVHSDSILLESGLKDLLESTAVLKVIHDVKRVSTLLAQRYAVNMRNIFDTQIAHTIIQHEKFSKPLCELHSISFVNLQRVYYPQSLMMSDVTPRKLSQTPNWSQRPISDEFLLTIAEECHCLMAALYRNVRVKLPEAHQALFEAKCLEALTPIPSKPPPQISATTTINGSANLALNNGFAKGNVGLQAAAAAAASATTPTVLKTINTDSGFNGIYRPPARRRILEVSAVQNSNGAALVQTPNNVSSPSLMRRKISAPTNTLATINNHLNNNVVKNGNNNTDGKCQCQCQQKLQEKQSTNMVDSSTQTISTGEITVQSIYYD